MYDPKSKKAEEFINHEEILDTLAYADAHKDDGALIDEIIAKARLKKGLSHREASVLLACTLEDKNQEVYELAREIKRDFYGDRIVMFAPLYLSNYCVNGCLYCPYHAKNRHIPRKKLTQDEIRAEVIALQDMGHKRLALEAGEDPVHNPLEYILESIQTIYSIQHKNRYTYSRGQCEYRRHHRGELPEAQGGGASAPTSSSRRRITRRATSICTPPVPRATMPTTPRPTTGPWRAASTTWAWAFSSAWSSTATSSRAC